jgi:flagellar assembly factor FliW
LAGFAPVFPLFSLFFSVAYPLLNLRVVELWSNNGLKNMKCTESNVAEQDVQTAPNGIINMPAGLLGFEQVKQYELLGSQEEAPFMWLRMVDDPSLAFLVIQPGHVLENYQPEVSEAEVEFLGLRSAEDAWVLNIVTLHRDGQATVNLKGPILINRHTLVAKQVVLLNATDFALQHPLSVVGR